MFLIYHKNSELLDTDLSHPYLLAAKRKEDDSVAGMSGGVVGRTVEGSSVCVKV